MRSRRAVTMLLAASLLALRGAAFAQCSYDREAGVVTNGLITLTLPAVGDQCHVEIAHQGEVLSGRQWYYCTSGDMQAAGERGFRSSGPVTAIEAVEDTPQRIEVRLTWCTARVPAGASAR